MKDIEKRLAKLEATIGTWTNDGHRYEIKTGLATYMADTIKPEPSGRLTWWCDDGGIVTKRTLLSIVGDVIITDYGEEYARNQD